MGKGSLSATDLAVFHHLKSCELYLHNVYYGSSTDNMSSSDRGSIAPDSELSKANYKRGNDWESHLFSWLDDNGLLLTIPSKPITGTQFIENLINDDRDYFFVAGLSFWPPEELKLRFLEAGTEPVQFGIAKPDLLEVKRTSDGFTWKVIDAKASNSVKVSTNLRAQETNLSVLLYRHHTMCRYISTRCY